MSKHTPGPLERGYYRPTDAFHSIKEHVGVMRPDGSLVAICGPTGDTASEADALLYAAAPELLEALKLYLMAGHKEARHQASVVAKAAIDKAEGRDQPESAVPAAVLHHGTLGGRTDCGKQIDGAAIVSFYEATCPDCKRAHAEFVEWMLKQSSDPQP